MEVKPEELNNLIHSRMPSAKDIKGLRVENGVAQFNWQGRHFAVKPTLETFEMKGDKLFITGMSILIQAALVTSVRNMETVAPSLKRFPALKSWCGLHPRRTGTRDFKN